MRKVILFMFYGLLIKTASAQEFESAFNGTDLTGWTVYQNSNDVNTGYVYAQNGAIVMDGYDKLHDYVWCALTSKPYKDFHLKLKFQGVRGDYANSGIQVRSNYDFNDGGGWLNGPQVDIGFINRNGSIWDETRTNQRWLYEDYSPKIFYWSDQGTGWNDLEVIVQGLKIIAIQNGDTITNYNGAGVLDDFAHTSRKVGTEGIIALQIHARDIMKIKYKDIYIKNLTCLSCPVFTVNPTTQSIGMKSGDNTSVAPFTITVNNDTPNSTNLPNLKLTPNVNWLTVTYSKQEGSKTFYTCTVNSNANSLPLGTASAKIEVSVDGALTQTITVNNTVTPGGPNLALNKPITASSIENNNTLASYANDGKLSTRWSSSFKDGESITIDLQASYDVDFIKINWEGAYANKYEIFMGDDINNLQQVYVQNSGNGALDEIVLEGMGRYIKLVCTSRATVYGSSLFEFEAYGTPSITTGIDNIDDAAWFNIFPNPVQSNQLTISTLSSDELFTVDVLSVNGELIYSKAFSNIESSVSIELPAETPSGLLFVRYTGKSGTHQKKLIKL